MDVSIRGIPSSSKTVISNVREEKRPRDVREFLIHYRFFRRGMRRMRKLGRNEVVTKDKIHRG